MFRQFVDLLKEVFWIKPARQKPGSKRRKISKNKPGPVSKLKKKPVKKKIIDPIKALAKPRISDQKPIKGPRAKLALVDPSLSQVGEITHYFDRIKVCVVKLTQGTVLIGDKLTIQGPKTKFVQKVWSMQIESEDVKIAKKGQIIGLKVEKPVVVGDKVYK